MIFKINFIKYWRWTVCLAILIQFINAQRVSAQSVMLAQYYQNPYLGNPALAGISEGLNLNMGLRNQWRNIPGSPLISTFTGDYQLEKVGVGLNIQNMKTGLFNRNRIVGTYAYHLPLNKKDEMLHFGLSLGVMINKLDIGKIIGEEVDDPTAQLYNARSLYIDGDFGMAYTTERFTLQGSVPNLKLLLKKDEQYSVEQSTLFLAMSYKLGQSLETTSIEPKIGYRGAIGMESVVDLGANVSFENRFSFMGMFHSTKGSSFGFGFTHDKFNIQGFYSTLRAAQREPTGGSFEVSVKVHLMKNGKSGSTY
ncbi:MAG TPA: type IX secretion system membrane protein PorP/SprF [Daejeonella sp.]|nr:type IX secretion system membrane protein PorP/SprF [Daejeonella sp.]